MRFEGSKLAETEFDPLLVLTVVDGFPDAAVEAKGEEGGDYVTRVPAGGGACRNTASHLAEVFSCELLVSVGVEISHLFSGV